MARLSASANDRKTLPVAVVCGRPNVGKSTLFNMLSQSQEALVAPVAGVTRDNRFVKAMAEGMPYVLTDTAGIEMGEDGLAGLMNAKVEAVLREADLVLFVVDGQAGLIAADYDLANYVRSFNKQVLLCINKADTKQASDTQMEAYALGFGEGVMVSAAHNRGIDVLRETLLPFLRTIQQKKAPEVVAVELAESEDFADMQNTELSDDAELAGAIAIDAVDEVLAKPLPLAIVGRPNAGKSTLVNALLNEERMLTGDLAGLTRESVGSLWELDGRIVELVDTPGIRKKAKVAEKLEKMSVGDAFDAINKAQAVVLVLDATCAFERQDAILADKIVGEGKPMVIALNKWDLIEDKDAALAELRHQLKVGFNQVKEVPVVPMSALKKRNLEKLMPEVFAVHQTAMRRISTGQLNRFLEGMLTANPPPIRGGRALKIKFMTQVAACPPTFALFVNRPKDFPESYVRYIGNGLRQAFDLGAVVIRVVLRSTENPYAKKKR